MEIPTVSKTAVSLHQCILYMLSHHGAGCWTHTGVNYEFSITISYAARFIHKEATLHSTGGAVIHVPSVGYVYVKPAFI